MDVQGFLGRHPVFTTAEFASYLDTHRPGATKTVESLLRYYTRRGRLIRIRRGLYAVVPRGFDPGAYHIDPYLIAAKMADDAVLAYHTALQFHGRAHSASSRFLYLTRRSSRGHTFRGQESRPVRFPKSLLRKRKEEFEVEEHARGALLVRVTGLERTLVDVLDRPDHGGGWEEVWRSLESVEYFDLDLVVEYALLLRNATTAAKVGFFLAQHRESLMVEERHLRTLRAHRPRSPHYLDRAKREPGQLIADWNLVVPLQVLERRWGEVP